MDKIQVSELNRACQLYLNLRLKEAYPLFRRFFDQLPVRPQKEHADYFGQFIRVLYELGREDELSFYRNTLENLYRDTATTEIGYQLGMSYLTSDEIQVKTAKRIFEKLIEKPVDHDLLAKIKMGLATCHDFLAHDWGVCTSIINSIEEKDLSPYLLDLVSVWKAKNLRDAGLLKEAEAHLGTLLSRVSAQFHWHAYFSAKIILGGVYLKQGRFERLLDLVSEVKAYCAQNPLRTIQRQIDYLAEQIKGEPQRSRIELVNSQRQRILSYEGKTIPLHGEQPWEKLLLLFLQDRIAPKTEIIKHLYHRKYRHKSDDKIIYAHIHSLKKNLLKLGLSEKTIVKEPVGYRWLPDVTFVEELPK